MTRSQCTALCRLAALAVPATLRAQEYPKTPPAPAALVPAPFPPFREAVLANGLRVLVVESHKQPIVSLSLSFPAGSIRDPNGKEGLADMVAGLLTKGTGSRSAEQVAEAIESAGGSLSASAGPDFLAVDATVLTPSLPLAFELMGDALLRPAFPDKELELLRTQTLSGLQVALTQPDEIADRAFRRALYGPQPYGRSASPASVRAISRADVVAFQQARLRPGGALLVVAGDVKPAEIQAMAARTFARWTGAAPQSPPAVAPAPRARTELILVHRPGSVQSNILAGNLSFLPNDPRIYSAAVVDQVLGGGAMSRLFMILREQKSWTYGAYARYARRKGIGFFEASTEVRTEVTDSALRELVHQLERIRTETIAGEELEAGKGALTGRYPLSIETADQVASAVATARLYGLPADYVQSYRVKIGAVTAAQAQSTARTTIAPDHMVIVVVGDGAKIYAKIKDVAPVTLVDVEGKPLSAEDLAPRTAALELDLATLVPRRDSFTISFQGNAIGWQRGVLEQTPAGFRYTEDTRLAAFVNQTTVLELDKSGAMRSLKQTGKVQGQDVAIDVSYEGGRARGAAKTPGPDRQIKTVTLDTTFAAGTLDDNAVQALLPALHWAPGAKWTMSVFSAGQGELKPWTLSVTGTEPVKLGARSVDAYRAELSGGTSPLQLWVSTTAPYQLLKVALVGQPVEFLRAP